MGNLFIGGRFLLYQAVITTGTSIWKAKASNREEHEAVLIRRQAVPW
jgi:hypothetical protein